MAGYLSASTYSLPACLLTWKEGKGEEEGQQMPVCIVCKHALIIMHASSSKDGGQMKLLQGGQEAQERPASLRCIQS